MQRSRPGTCIEGEEKRQRRMRSSGTPDTHEERRKANGCELGEECDTGALIGRKRRRERKASERDEAMDVLE